MGFDQLMRRFFRVIVGSPKSFILMSFLLIVIAATQFKSIKKDASANAYIPADHPALAYRDKVKETFGLDDPLVIAIINENESGIFNPSTLELVRWFSDSLIQVPNVDPDKITSLTTVKHIKGTDDSLDVTPYLDSDSELTPEYIKSIQDNIFSTPLYQGSLISQNGQGTMIVVELLDGTKAPATYNHLIELAAKAPTSSEQIYIAGEGAVRGYLQVYMSEDARKMVPLAMVFILIMLSFAYRTLRSVTIPAVVILGTIITTIGLMAAEGIPFYVITNALPVILIGIAVADSLHIFGEYYEQVRANPAELSENLVIDTMMCMWRPITLTTLTSIAGFVGIYFAEIMLPMAYFGLYSAIGVAMAWLYSLVFLPASLVILKPIPSRLFKIESKYAAPNPAMQRLSSIGLSVYRYSNVVLILAVVIFVVGGYSASQVLVDEERITSFRKSEPLYIADSRINRFFSGTNTLDIVIQTRDEEGLFDADALLKMEELQEYIEKIPGVGGSTSIVEHLKQINKAIHENDPAYYRIPQDRDLIAQYFLMYSVSGDPDDFESYIDFNYQTANIRVYLKTGRYTVNKPVVETIQAYIDQNFSTTDVQANISGRVNVDYHWIQLLGDSHFKSVGIALLLVLMMASLVFRSFIAGVIAILPVMFSVLLIYSIMGVTDIWLGIGTSMFAAIAIGLGVDFSIHTLQRFIILINDEKLSLKQAVAQFFPSTGRVLLFNFLSVGLGFGVLLISHVIPLVRFGALVAIGISVSFVASVTIIPSCIKLLKPRLFRQAAFSEENNLGDSINYSATSRSANTIAAMLLCGSAFMFSNTAEATPALLPDGNAVVAALNAQSEGKQLKQKMHILLKDRRGKKRKSETSMFRKYFGDDKKIMISYNKPKSVRGTAFLIFDYQNKGSDDDQWLYIPALRKVRRVSSSERGEYFLGTDFTYDDIKNGGKIEEADYEFTLLGVEDFDNRKMYKIECIPKSASIIKELGYSKVIRWIDTEYFIVRKAKYWDVAGNDLKTVVSNNYEKINGIWKAHHVVATNHKSGHSSEFTFTEVDFNSNIRDSVFTKRALQNAR